MSLLVAESGERLTISCTSYLCPGWEQNPHPMVVGTFMPGSTMIKDGQTNSCTAPSILHVRGDAVGSFTPIDDTDSTTAEFYIVMDATRRAGIARMKPQATNTFLRAVRENQNGVMHKGYFYIGTYCGEKLEIQIADENTLIMGRAKLALESDVPVLSFL